MNTWHPFAGIRSAMIRNALTLMSGTALAQFLPLLILPLLSRLYTQAQFGDFGLFVAIVLVVSTAADLRYSLAILLPEDPARALSILWLCLLSAVLVSAVFAAALPLTTAWQPTWLRDLPLRGLLPIATFFLSINNSLYAWANRQRAYGLMARNKVLQSVVTSTLMVLLALPWLQDGHGMVYAYLAGYVLSSLGLLGALGAEEWMLIRRGSWSSVLHVAREFRRFPLASLPADLINAVTNALPSTMLISYFTSREVGLFNMTNRIMLAPSTVIAKAIYDVFKERAARDYAAQGSCRPIYIKTIKALFAISLPLFCGLALVAPPLFAVVLGPAWREAGYYCQILTPLFVLRFAATPLSYVLYAAGKQHYDLVWQIGLFCAVWGALALGGWWESPRWSVGLFSLVYSVAYLCYLGMSYTFSEKKTLA